MRAILFATFLVSASCVGIGQSSTSVPQPHIQSAVPVTFGQSVFPLYGPWKFHIGDNPRWADPTFSDSDWETVDLTPTPQTTLPAVPIPGFVTGWTARGHAGYAGYAWYRMKVRVRGAESPLTLLGPEWFDSAFQVFANGRLIGSFGDFSGSVPRLYEGGPSEFSLRQSDYSREPDGSILIAFRFYMSAASLVHRGTGGIHAAPRIALPAVATALFQMEAEREYRRLGSATAACLLYFVFALLIAMLFAFNRTEKILLWPLSACVLQVLQFALIFSTNVPWLSEVPLEALIGALSLIAGYLWLVTWWAYFGLQHARWLFKTIVALSIWNLLTLEFFTIVPRIGRPSPALTKIAVERISGISNGSAVFLLIVIIAWLGWKRAERRHWSLYLALSFFSIQVFEPVMALLHLRTTWQPFGVLLPLDLIAVFLSLICFSVVLFGQFRSSLQRQQVIAEDLKQAQEMQHLLIPDRLPRVPGWSIETEYHPAREVGGDFFQIIPHPSNGSILIVAGDVAGKGLQAGMLVAMLVGAIRTESTHSSDPVQMLKALNGRLCGEHALCGAEHAQATCLALLIDEDGDATLANAGHLPPYLNGFEINIEGSLPLGMIAEVEFATMNFRIDPGDRLLLMSDGIVEAQNERGDLFGFDRIRILVSKQVSAAEIANAAQEFGQQDDISVLSIVRVPVTIEAIS
jgi:hypothetical protein